MDREAWRTLGEYKHRLTRQQIRTLAGQIKTRQPDAAMNGLAKILNRQDGVPIYGATKKGHQPNRV